jgi:hypothetical protein
VKGLVRRQQQGKEERVEFTVPCTANSLRASRRRAARALRWEDEEEEEVLIVVWLAEGASYLNSPRHATTVVHVTLPQYSSPQGKAYALILRGKTR